MAEEYCWAITQTEGRSWCGRSGSGVLECAVFQLDSLKYIVGYMHGLPYNVNPAQFGERLYAVQHKFWSDNGTRRNFKISAGKCVVSYYLVI
jgi:hypothetical protein